MSYQKRNCELIYQKHLTFRDQCLYYSIIELALTGGQQNE